jgi:putative heme-binding domain-containing protein
MPYVGSREVDAVAVDTLARWIAALPGGGRKASPAHAAAAELLADGGFVRSDPPRSSRDTATADRIDAALASTDGALALARAVAGGRLAGAARAAVLERAARHEAPAVGDLFARWLPEGTRAPRLGTDFTAAEILAREGERERGEKLFFERDGVTCGSCHRVGKRGTSTGPELTGIGAKRDRAQLLQSIVEPSAEIDPEYRAYLVVLESGETLTGLLEVNASSGDARVTTPDGRETRLRGRDILRLVEQNTSVMPEHLLREPHRTGSRGSTGVPGGVAVRSQTCRGQPRSGPGRPAASIRLRAHSRSSSRSGGRGGTA